MKLVTIGVYGFDNESFLRELRDAGVRVLLIGSPSSTEYGSSTYGREGMVRSGSR